LRVQSQPGSSGTDHDDGDHPRDDDSAEDDRKHDGDGSAADDPPGHRADDNDDITESSASTTPTWVWVLLGAVALAAIGLLAAFLTRRGGQRGVPGEERRRRLDGAVASWMDRAGMGDRQSDGGLRRLAPRQRGAARRR